MEEDNDNSDLLHQAALYNNVQLMESLLLDSAHQHINNLDHLGRTPLFISTSNNNLECSHLLLMAGADPNKACSADYKGMTPLHAASEKNQKGLVDLLLDYNADVSRVDAWGRKPADTALLNHSHQCLTAIKNHMEISVLRKQEARYALLEAFKSCDVSMVDKIVCSLKLSKDELRAIVNKPKCEEHEHDVLYSVCRQGNVEMCELLVGLGAELRVEASSGLSPVHISCLAGNVHCLRVLLESFPQHLYIPTFEGSYPVHLGCMQGYKEVVVLLVEMMLQHISNEAADNEKKVNKCNRNSKETSKKEKKLGEEIPLKDLDISPKKDDYINNNNANYHEDIRLSDDSKSNSAQRTFKISDYLNCKESFEAFLSHMNVKDSRGCTALHITVLGNLEDLTQFLLNLTLDHSEFLEFKNHSESIQDSKNESISGNGGVHKKGKVPSVSVVSESHETSLKIARRSVMMVDSLAEDGQSALHMAISNLKGNMNDQTMKIIELLLQHGANPNLDMPIRNESAKLMTSQPLFEAVKLKDGECVELLLRYGGKDDGQRALKEAVEGDDEEIVGDLIASLFIIDHEHRPVNFSINATNKSDCPTNSNRMSVSNMKSIDSRIKGLRLDWNLLALKTLCHSWFVKASHKYYSNIVPAIYDSSLSTNDFTWTITRIDLSFNELCLLNGCVFTFRSLKKLDLSNNKIEFISLDNEDSENEDETKIDTTQNFELQFESCENTEISHFEKTQGRESIDEITKTQDISVSINDSFKHSYLEEINFSKNHLKVFPDYLLKLASLQRLNLSYNKISKLPLEIWTKTSLIELNLSHNFISVLTLQEDNDLTLSCDKDNFKSFSLNSDEILTYKTSSFPFDTESTSDIEDSEESIFKSNEDYSFKPVFDWRHQIKLHPSMYGGDSSIEGSQDTGSSKAYLQELDLSYNLFEDFPTELPCLAYNLEKLNLSGNKLKSFGSVHNYPPKLQLLDLSHNEIQSDDTTKLAVPARASSTLRPSSASRPNIKQSCLNFCNASFLIYNTGPRTASSMRRGSIKNAFSSSNFSSPCSPNPFFSCKHCLHTQLFKLKTLLLNNNRLNSFEFRCKEDIFQLAKLTNLKQKSSLPKNPPKSLFPNLLTLDLSHNHFSHLLKDIGLLSNLTTLNIAHNSIKELPSEIGSLKKLWSLNLAGNPVEGILRSLLGEKMRLVSSLVSYLKAIKDKAVAYNHMKLMMVGKQGVGKTSVINMLNAGRSHKSQSGPKKPTKGKGSRGINIGELVLRRAEQEVVFSTWDFGGQKEYYVTHQYFLSKRSIYLLVWRLTDGAEGINEIFKWLINIQARAPGSAVVIVGTHLDKVTTTEASFMTNVARLIETKYINLEEPDRWGFPKVVGHVELCARKVGVTKQHTSTLQDAIWRAVNFSLDKQGIRLVDQRVPVTYIHLQKVVAMLASEQTSNNRDPVLSAEDYKKSVIDRMEEKFESSFKDVSELNQATNFLHDNGVLLHYDDQSLRHLYFLDPQWLCDILACIVTPQEINRLGVNGVMKVDDLPNLFKGVAFKTHDLKRFMIRLLQKFEVALQWDHKHLLIPALLPTDAKDKHQFVMIPTNEDADSFSVEPSATTFPSFSSHFDTLNSTTTNNINFNPNSKLNHSSNLISPPSSDSNLSPRHVSDPTLNSRPLSPTAEINNPTITRNSNPALSYFRLYTMSYFPSGFWSRLMTRMLGDALYSSVLRRLYNLSGLQEHSVDINNLPGCYWHCWQTGLELKHLSLPILRVKEISSSTSAGVFEYHRYHLVLKEENNFTWSSVLNLDASMLEIVVFNESFTLKPSDEDGLITIYPTSETAVRLLTMVVEQIDTLLEDWYPSIGTRFTKDIKGSMLINRLVPCTQCLMQQEECLKETCIVEGFVKIGADDYDAGLAASDGCGGGGGGGIGEGEDGNDTRGGMNKPGVVSVVGGSAGASGVGGEEVGNGGSNSGGGGGGVSEVLKALPIPLSPNHATFRALNILKEKLLPTSSETTNSQFSRQFLNSRKHLHTPVSFTSHSESPARVVYCLNIEQCIQIAQMNKIVSCPRHGNLGPAFAADLTGFIHFFHVAPDTVFYDLNSDLLISHDLLHRRHFLGKGTFGAVFSGHITHRLTETVEAVALKFLQPVMPEEDLPTEVARHIKRDISMWNKDPCQSCCEAYTIVRKELSILLNLQHPHVVPLIGLSVSPLCLILALAPLGSLNEHLKRYAKYALKLPLITVKEVIVQVSSALKYLHSKQIIYRDLKSENILVWSFPDCPAENLQHQQLQPANVKLADYGVSRVVLPSGTKGLAGTLPFMAPEIILQNGEETYTEKVDCYSFALLMYELLTLKFPYEGDPYLGTCKINLKSHVLAGGRPALKMKETRYPTNVLELLTSCWSHDPEKRPSANQIEAFSTQPEFCALLNAWLSVVDVKCACVLGDVRRDGEGDGDNDGGVAFATSATKSYEILIYGESSANSVSSSSSSHSSSSSSSSSSVKSKTKKCSNLFLYSCSEEGDVQIKKLHTDVQPILCMCVVGVYVWCASHDASIHIYRCDDFSLATTFRVTQSATSIAHMCLVGDSVCVVLDDGRFVLCSTHVNSDGSAHFAKDDSNSDHHSFCSNTLNDHSTPSFKSPNSSYPGSTNNQTLPIPNHPSPINTTPVYSNSNNPLSNSSHTNDSTPNHTTSNTHFSTTPTTKPLITTTNVPSKTTSNPPTTAIHSDPQTTPTTSNPPPSTSTTTTTNASMLKFQHTGNGGLVHCMFYVQNNMGRYLWCGQSHGVIVVWRVGSVRISQVSNLTHSPLHLSPTHHSSNSSYIKYNLKPNNSKSNLNYDSSNDIHTSVSKPAFNIKSVDNSNANSSNLKSTSYSYPSSLSSSSNHPNSTSNSSSSSSSSSLPSSSSASLVNRLPNMPLSSSKHHSLSSSSPSSPPPSSPPPPSSQPQKSSSQPPQQASSQSTSSPASLPLLPYLCDTVSVVGDAFKPSHLYSYVYPGTCIYQWNHISNIITAFVHFTSFLTPSPPSQNDESHHITCMSVFNKHLYLATSRGFLISLHTPTLLPTFICQPHSTHPPGIITILPLSSPSSSSSSSKASGKSSLSQFSFRDYRNTRDNNDHDSNKNHNVNNNNQNNNNHNNDIYLAQTSQNHDYKHTKNLSFFEINEINVNSSQNNSVTERKFGGVRRNKSNGGLERFHGLNEGMVRQECHMFVTIGRGYRSLSDRIFNNNIHNHNNNQNCHSHNKIVNNINYSNSKNASPESNNVVSKEKKDSGSYNGREYNGKVACDGSNSRDATSKCTNDDRNDAANDDNFHILTWSDKVFETD